jgi:hypothetical protein
VYLHTFLVWWHRAIWWNLGLTYPQRTDRQDGQTARQLDRQTDDGRLTIAIAYYSLFASMYFKDLIVGMANCRIAMQAAMMGREASMAHGDVRPMKTNIANIRVAF